MKHSMAKVMLQLQLLRLHMNSIRNRLGKQKVLRTMEGVGEGVIFTSHTAQTIENDLWLLKCLNWTATQYVKQTKIVCSPVGNRQVIWLKDLYSIQALICMHVHTCVHTHTHTHTHTILPTKFLLQWRWRQSLRYGSMRYGVGFFRNTKAQRNNKSISQISLLRNGLRHSSNLNW